MQLKDIRVARCSAQGLGGRRSFCLPIITELTKNKIKGKIKKNNKTRLEYFLKFDLFILYQWCSDCVPRNRRAYRNTFTLYSEMRDVDNIYIFFIS